MSRSLRGSLVILLLVVQTAWGQTTTAQAPLVKSVFDPISLSDGGTSQQQRDAQYAALSRDVDALERELGIVKRVVKLVTPAVVHIESLTVARHVQIEEEGSGVIVQFGRRHYVLTNRHVIRSASRSKIDFRSKIDIHLADGRLLTPSRTWDDPQTDVAVMAIDAPSLAVARVGDSDRLEIGDYVLAVGSPFGLSQSVTRGIVSAKGRYDLELGDGELEFMDFIQTDAAINPGNSGGPLVNLRGEVVALNTAIASSSGGNEGIGFAIPINVVAGIARELVQGREPPRGRLGVRLAAVYDETDARAIGLQQLTGTRITEVEPNSPAELAGLKANDVIVLYDGQRIERDRHLITRVKLTPIGRSVELVVIRDGQPIRKSVIIGDLREAAQPDER